MTAGQDGSGSGDMGRCRLWLAVLVCLAPVVARAQDGTDAFRRAEREFTAGRYAEAEPLYRRAAASGYDALRITCYQRLMQITAAWAVSTWPSRAACAAANCCSMAAPLTGCARSTCRSASATWSWDITARPTGT